MFACKDIFAKPSITQAHKVRKGRSPRTCDSKAFCVYYTTKLVLFQPHCVNTRDPY